MGQWDKVGQSGTACVPQGASCVVPRLISCLISLCLIVLNKYKSSLFMDNRHLIYSPINLYFRIHSVQ
nr:MAG TPA: hypothetical protein [Caudoviricetes sp.]